MMMSTVSDSVTGEKRCVNVSAPIRTKICTVVIYSHTKLVLKFGEMYIKISRFGLILPPEPLGKTDWWPGASQTERNSRGTDLAGK